jgi:hypothetical protein
VTADGGAGWRPLSDVRSFGVAATPVSDVATADWLARADDFERQGRLLDAIDALTHADRLVRDAEVERRLVRLRHQAFAEVTSAGREPGPLPSASDGDRGGQPGPFVVSPNELTPEALRTGILQRGSVLVPQLIPMQHVERLVDDIDQAFKAQSDHASRTSDGPCSPWFEPFKLGSAYPLEERRRFAMKRKWVTEWEGVWTADAPRAMFDLIEVLNESGLGSVINRYLGERPAFSLDKGTLRRVGQHSSANWHQDGAFLGEGIRSVNVWMALSDCGRDAPGLDIVPKRFDGLVETGTGGAIFQWSVGSGVVARVSEDAPVCRPLFKAGDVLLFDDLCLHRTGVDPSMTRDRYAIETWLFAPSAYPEGHVPFVL